MAEFCYRWELLVLKMVKTLPAFSTFLFHFGWDNRMFCMLQGDWQMFICLCLCLLLFSGCSTCSFQCSDRFLATASETMSSSTLETYQRSETTSGMSFKIFMMLLHWSSAVMFFLLIWEAMEIWDRWIMRTMSTSYEKWNHFLRTLNSMVTSNHTLSM